MRENSINQTIDHLFRHESGRLVAALSRLLGLQHIDAAEDLVQDTLLQAMNTWRFSGLPDHPSAWLYRVAKNKAIDYLRRNKKFREISPRYAYLVETEAGTGDELDLLFEEEGLKDSQLRMIFACCHPAISPESQIAFVLKTLCGLSSGEISRAFLTNEETIAKRIYRAKEKIRAERIELELPDLASLPQRLDSVLLSLYLLFNEGYNSSHPSQLIREDLCAEAMRLAFLLTQQKITNLPRTKALLALFCFQASRLQARLDDQGLILLLKYQDRSKWFRPLMEKGFAYLEASMDPSGANSTYHLEAAIASLHAAAPNFEATDWPAIYFLYGKLYELKPGPVIALNRAIAASYALDKATALQQMLEIKGLDHYYLYHTSIGELCFELDKKPEALKYFERALQLTSSDLERRLIQDKIDHLG